MSIMKFLLGIISLTLAFSVVNTVVTVHADGQDRGGFTAVAGTDRAVTDSRKKNNTALAIVAGVGTVTLFSIGLSASRKN